MRALFMADKLITLMEGDPRPVPPDAVEGLAEILAGTRWGSHADRDVARSLLRRLALVRRDTGGPRPGTAVATGETEADTQEGPS